MSVTKIKGKDSTEFEGPVETGDTHAKRAADKKKVGDMEADTSVAKSGKYGTELPGTTTIGEEVAELFKDVEGLSEGFVEKASTIFEGAVSEKVTLIREEIENEYNERLEEAVAYISEDLEDKLSSYLDLFVEKYLDENRVAIEKGFRTELAESVMESIVDIVESAGVELPDDKIDIADALVAENEDLANRLNSALNEQLEAKKTIRKYEIAEAFTSHTEGLSEATKDKLRKLTENIDYASVDQFVSKLDILKESLTPTTASADNLTEATEAVNEDKQPVTNPRMQAYIKHAAGLRS